MKKLLIVISLLILSSAAIFAVIHFADQPEIVNNMKEQISDNSTATSTPQSVDTIDFSTLNEVFVFSAELPSPWQVTYLAEVDSLNIFDPTGPADNDLDNSVIFILNFTANSFLILSTVDIVKRENTVVGSRDAVAYEIKKKPGVPNFSGQPAWRNEQHKLIDIRLTNTNPSTFFVFSYNPSLPESVFNEFIASLQFEGDPPSNNSPAAITAPLENAAQRITKKPFGIQISPDNSPVQPERFSGFHTGTDFEILPGEENTDVAVFAICTGPLLQKRTASGYGGVAIQSCTINDDLVTVTYGHIDLASITQTTGSEIVAGQQFAILGDGFTDETDNERKHLHLSIHKGSVINIAGYVTSQGALSNWLDYQAINP